MQCHICGHILSGEQVSWSNLHQEWDPCPTCLQEIAEVFSDPLDEDEITYALEKEGIIEPDEKDHPLDTILLDKSD
jgi:hypothetical protein